MWIKILVSAFALFVLLRIYLNAREKRLTRLSAILWSLLWLAVVTVFWSPDLASWIAFYFGIGRGADLAVYVSIILILYLVYRIFIRLERIEREITTVARARALTNEHYKDSRRDSDR